MKPVTSLVTYKASCQGALTAGGGGTGCLATLGSNDKRCIFFEDFGSTIIPWASFPVCVLRLPGHLKGLLLISAKL